MKQKIYNTLYGAIVADALGVPVEFKDRDYLKENPVTDMIGYGTYNLPKKALVVLEKLIMTTL